MCTHLDTLLNSIPTTEGEVTEGSKKVFQAFSKDITNMENKIKMLSEEIKSVKEDVADVKSQVSNVEGKVDTILELVENRFNSSVDEERLTGAIVNRILKSKKVWIALVIVMFLLILSGISITYFLDRANDVAVLAEAASKLK